MVLLREKQLRVVNAGWWLTISRPGLSSACLAAPLWWMQCSAVEIYSADTLTRQCGSMKVEHTLSILCGSLRQLVDSPMYGWRITAVTYAQLGSQANVCKPNVLLFADLGSVESHTTLCHSAGSDEDRQLEACVLLVQCARSL